MSNIESSFFRKLIYASPLLLIIGIVMMFIDYEIGVPFLGAGVIGLIITLITVLRGRRENRAPAVEEEPIVIKSQGKFCADCGKNLEDSVVFCKNCGIHL